MQTVMRFSSDGQTPGDCQLRARHGAQHWRVMRLFQTCPPGLSVWTQLHSAVRPWSISLQKVFPEWITI